MINIPKLIKSNLHLPKFADMGAAALKTFVAGSSIPTLLQPILSQLSNMKLSISAYDAFNTAISSADSVFDAVAADTVDGDPLNPKQEYAEVSDDEASIISAGLLQSREYMRTLGESVLNVTSANGLQYCIDIGDTDSKGVRIFSLVNGKGYHSPLLYYDEARGKYLFLKNWISTKAGNVARFIWDNDKNILSAARNIASKESQNYTGVANIISMLRSVASVSDGTIVDLVWAIATKHHIHFTNLYQTLMDIIEKVPGQIHTLVDTAVENVLAILNSTIQSTEINALFYAAFLAIKAGTFKRWISDKYNEIKDKMNAAATVAKNLYKAFCEGGLKGAILYIYKAYKSGTSIENDDGTLKMTDNLALLPREYIAGMVASALSALTAVVGLILSAIQPVVGALLSALGAIATAVFGSFKNDSDNTHASFYYSDDEEKQACTVPYCPTGFFSGSFDNDKTVAWVEEFYSDEGLFSLPVPGGALFIGPKTLNDKGAIATWAWEFHPSALVYNREVARGYFPWFYVLTDHKILTWKDYVPFPQFKRRAEVYSSWMNFLSADGCFRSDVVNGDNGVLSDYDDRYVFGSLCFSIVVFMIWLYNWKQGSSDYDRYYWSIEKVDPSQVVENDQSHIFMAASSFIYPGDLYGTFWKELIRFASDSQHSGVYDSGTIWRVDSEGYCHEVDWKHSISNNPKDVAEAIANIAVWPAQSPKRLNTANPIPLPHTLYYAIEPPRYNARTFWLYVAAGCVITAAVTAATVVTAVKVTKWKRAKRANNVAAFGDAQNTYHNAANGVKEVYNPQTKQFDKILFDKNSKEGKAYISSCYRDYRKVAFKNNMWANIIGGSRYDVSSFWGEAETEEDTEEASSEASTLLEDIRTYFDSSTDGSDLQSEPQFSASAPQDNIQTDGRIDSVYKAITGSSLTIL